MCSSGLNRNRIFNAKQFYGFANLQSHLNTIPGVVFIFYSISSLKIEMLFIYEELTKFIELALSDSPKHNSNSHPKLQLFRISSDNRCGRTFQTNRLAYLLILQLINQMKVEWIRQYQRIILKHFVAILYRQSTEIKFFVEGRIICPIDLTVSGRIQEHVT